MKLIVDKDLSYYPTQGTLKKIKIVLKYVMERPEGVSQGDIWRTYKLSPLWMERLDKIGIVRISSIWVGFVSKNGGCQSPVRYIVKIWNVKKAQQLVNFTPKTFKSKETEIADRINKLIDQKGEEALEYLDLGNRNQE